MPKALKPTKLLFGVKTAKRRTLPKEYHVSITLEADKADIFFDYVASEVKKIEQVVRTQMYPPGYVQGVTMTPKAVETQTANPQE